jgi:putative membrane protein
MKPMFPSKSTSAALMLIVFAGSWINPLWPAEQALHGSLTLVAFCLLWWIEQKYPFSKKDFFLIALFLSTHSIAARWLYSNTPYDAWCQSLFGFSVSRLFGWSRNNFDRLVHFMYGACVTPAFVSLFTVRYRQNPKNGFYFAIIAVMVTSLWYEWFEWLIAMTLPANAAEAYIGQQGDIWDSHKDMLLASLGSFVWAGKYLVNRKGQNRSGNTPN